MITNMKKYENPMLQIVSINNNDIVTASLPKGTNPVTDPGQIQAPGRKSIWDYVVVLPSQARTIGRAVKG